MMCNMSFESPWFSVSGPSMKKTSAISVRSRSGTFPSPCTPNYCHGGGAAGYHKGWSSERVPLPANSSRRLGSSTSLLTFRNGRTVPSKWEDAEKWIFNPISGEGGSGSPLGPLPHHRRPKSKSGPLGTPVGIGGSYASASPLMPGSGEEKIRNFTASSPFLTGVLVTERGCYGSSSSGRSRIVSEGVVGPREGGRRSYSAHADQGIVQSASVRAWSDMLIESSSSLPSSRDEKFESAMDDAIIVSSMMLTKDAATQMSPEGSTSTSSKELSRFSLSSPSSSPTIKELQRQFSKLEVRDVQVDDLVIESTWSKMHEACGTGKDSLNVAEWEKTTVEPRASAWEVADTTKCMLKFKREEAKITAWENLQKAKAEAAIRKLEMQLEKKRSSKMDKIVSKLRSAQRKAEDMRNAVAACQVDPVAGRVKKAPSFRQRGSLSGCFTCHAF